MDIHRGKHKTRVFCPAMCLIETLRVKFDPHQRDLK